MAELIPWTKTKAVLDEYARRAQELYKGTLEQHGRVATKGLLNSIRAEVVVNESISVSVVMHLAKYWRYVEWGTRPHWPPPGVLLPWIEAKVIPHPQRTGKLPTPASLDFLIRRKIAEEGTEGTQDLHQTVELLNKEFMSRIEDAVAEDIGSLSDAVIRSL